MKTINTIRIDNFGSIAIVIFVVAHLLDHLNIGHGLVLPMVGFYGYLFLIEPYVIHSKPNLDNQSILLFAIIMFFLRLISGISIDFIPLKETMAAFSYIGLSIILLKTKVNDKIIDLLFFCIMAFFVMHIVIGTDPNEIFRTSRNSISMFTILCTVLVLIVKSNNDKKISPIYVTLNFIICLWAVGRSGILSSFILLLGFFISYFKKQIVRPYHVVVLLLILVLSSVVKPGIFYSAKEQFQVTLDRLINQGLTDISRGNMITTYVDAMKSDASSFLFGVDMDNIPLFIKFDGNPHNSYLRLHSKYGILGLVIIIIFLVKTVWQLLKQKNILLFICLLAVSMRISTDISAFTGMFDIIIYYFIFKYGFKHHNQ